MAASDSERERLAFEIFAKQVAGVRVNRVVEQEAIEAFRKADTFIAAREKVKAGALKESVETEVLADCRAPNMPAYHPLNLVARNGGNLEKVRRIYKLIEQTQSVDDSAQTNLVERINRTFPELQWDMSALNVARSIFPAYCKETVAA